MVIFNILKKGIILSEVGFIFFFFFFIEIILIAA